MSLSKIISCFALNPQWICPKTGFSWTVLSMLYSVSLSLVADNFSSLSNLSIHQILFSLDFSYLLSFSQLVIPVDNSFSKYDKSIFLCFFLMVLIRPLSSFILWSPFPFVSFYFKLVFSISRRNHISKMFYWILS